MHNLQFSFCFSLFLCCFIWEIKLFARFCSQHRSLNKKLIFWGVELNLITNMLFFLKRVGVRGREYFGADVSAFSREKKFYPFQRTTTLIGNSAFCNMLAGNAYQAFRFLIKMVNMTARNAVAISSKPKML